MAAVANGPPKGADASEVWRKLSARPRPVSDAFDFPEEVDGKPIGQYRLRILTEEELHFSRREADVAAKSMMGQVAPKQGELSYGYEDIYRNELSVQLVALACRDADDPHRWAFFPSAAAARKRLTTDQIAVILSAYNMWRADVGPQVSELTAPELEAWVKLLMEGGRRAPLARLTSEALTDLVMHLVSKVRHSAATGSAGSPPDDSSSSPEPEAGSVWAAPAEAPQADAEAAPEPDPKPPL